MASENAGYRRLQRDRAVTRRVAELVASERPLPELLREFSLMLSGALGAARICIEILGDHPQRFEFGKRSGNAPERVRVPVTFGGETVATIDVVPAPGAGFDAGDEALVETCALHLGARVRAYAQPTTDEGLEQLARTDASTGLANRRGFDEALEAAWTRCAEAGSPLCVALLDVDFFKRYNDAFGHVEGDRCLRDVARAVAVSAREAGAFAARYGGEEFAAILPACDGTRALAFAESACAAIRALGIPHPGSTLATVSASIGVASAVPEAGRDPKSLVQRADELLYEAKASGRNRVAAEGYASDAAPAHASHPVKHSLPSYLTPILGRQREADELDRALRDGAVVTLVGSGGVGKTRLAVEVATRWIDRCPDGVWFADLAPLRDSQLVPSTVAGAAGVSLPAGQPTADALAGQIKNRRVLLVIDNCEHVLTEVARLAGAIATAAPGVRVLATSRAPLRVPGETVVKLDGLDDDTAIALFEERARRHDHRARVSESERPAIAQVCRRLDGVALAIELAAARSRVLPPPQLLERLGERLNLLTSGDRTASPRQQTLRAMIGWSYELLTQSQRATFRRIGVFSGSFEPAAAARVVESAEPERVADQLRALSAQSLLVEIDGGARYRLLDSTRDYALERLAEAGEEFAARRAHAAYVGHVSHRLGTRALSEDAFLATHAVAVDDFRAAIEWATAHDVDLAAGIAGHVALIWRALGLGSEGLRRTQGVLDALGARSRDAVAIPLWLAIAAMPMGTQSFSRCIEAGDTAFALAQAAGDRTAMATARWRTGFLRFNVGVDPERGMEDLGFAAEYFRAYENPVGSASALSDYAYAISTTRPAESRAMLEEQVRTLRAAGAQRQVLLIENKLAEMDFAAGDTQRAISRLQRVIVAERAQRDALILATSLSNVACYLAVAGAYEDAKRDALAAMEIGAERETEHCVAYPCQTLALVAAAGGDAAGAARLLGYVDGFYQRLGGQREPTEVQVEKHLLATLRRALSDGDIAAYRDEGRTLTVEDAIALARAV